jgi:hypothetical protein
MPEMEKISGPSRFQLTLKMVHHSYFHSVINYGIIFWENSSYSNSIFTLQKRKDY